VNKQQHAFDPSSQLIVSDSARRSAIANYPLESRQLFYYLIHISEHYSVLSVAKDYVDQALAVSRIQHHEDLIQNIDIEALQFTPQQSINLNLFLTDSKQVKALLVQFAPIILTSPCWLQSIAQTAFSDKDIAVDLFALYLSWQTPQADSFLPLHDYQSLLLTYGCELPAISTWTFSQQNNINEVMFDLGTLQLALGQLPRVYLPEILGFTWACFQGFDYAGSLASTQLKSAHLDIAKFLIKQQQLAAAHMPLLKRIIKRYLQTFSQQEQPLWQRIQHGYWLYRYHIDHCLQQQKQSAKSPQQALIELLQRVAPLAAGHHGRIELKGKNVDDWFSQKPFAGEEFLAALRASDYVDKQHPEQSRLLTLFDFSGPMFGVLKTQERQLLKDWLINPGEEQFTADFSTQKVALSAPVSEPSSPPINFAGLCNRELYYYLANADLYPEVYVTAQYRIQKLLAKIRWLVRLPFNNYQHQRLEAYIQNHYQREMAAYKPLQAQPKLSRKTYVWGIEQLAPTILTDGCWLQGVGQLQFYTNRKVGANLFSIYSDELGAGKRVRNHPNIYRQLLQSLDIILPPTHSREFIEHPGFIAGVFDLPVYLMSIGHFPGEFLPEMLGVNLAIELSGLGRVYMTLADELKYWGIDSSIVNIHISIDNAATGHTVLAKNAIQLHLDGILANHGVKVMNKHWRRIYIGYCSLRWASMRFKYSLGLKYLQKRSELK
jgi:hypothetical protein